MVTITVTDMDEAPDVTGDDMTEYAENGTGLLWRRTPRWILRVPTSRPGRCLAVDAALTSSIDGGVLKL